MMDLYTSHQWLLLSITAIAFIESFAFAGIAVPGVALLFAAATLAGQQATPLALTLLAAYIGAVLGDVSSYYLGRYAAPLVRRLRLFQRYPHWLQHGEAFFRKYGTFSIVLGRFVGPIRPVIPFIAGALKMRTDLFIGFNLLSALAWAPAYILPGYLLGSSSATLNPQWLPLSYLLAGIVIALLLFHKLHQWLQPEEPLTRQLVKWLKLHRIWPRGQPLPVPALLLLATMAVLLCILSIVQLSGAGAEWNRGVLHSLHSTLGSQPVLVAATLLGDRAFLLPLVGITAACLYAFGLRPLAVGYLLMTLLASLSNLLLKGLFTVARPETGQWLDSFSFPSGHASAASAVLAMLAVIIAGPLQQRLRRYIYLLFAIPVFAVAISRVALGAHWPLDSLAGLAEGLMIAALFRILSGLYGWQQQQPPRSGAALAVLTLTGAILYISLNLNAALHLYGAAG